MSSSTKYPPSRSWPSTYAFIVAALFALQAIFAIVHRATGRDYQGYTHTFSVVTDLALAVIWVAAAIAGVVRRSGFAFTVLAVAAAVTLNHGFLFSVTTSSFGPYGVGVPFVMASGLEALLMVRAAPAFRPGAVAAREEHEEHPPGVAHWALDRLRTAFRRPGHAH